MATIFVDFDGTICPNKGMKVGVYPDPFPECIFSLQRLKAAGHTIVIYSVRSNKLETNRATGHEEMVEYLNKHKVPYDSIDSSKVHFTYIIDDKGCGVPMDSNHNVDWNGVLRELHAKNYVGV